MDVLLIGGESVLVDSLINRYSKENDRVYWVTGTKVKSRRSRRVFGQFDFEVDSESLSDIISGVSPDLIIYMGAYDATFDWSDESRDGRRFLSGVSNILISACLQPHCRSILLSSELPFSAGVPQDIPEEYQVDYLSGGCGLRGQVAMDAEQQWLASKRLYGSDAIVLRLDHLYSLPMRNQIMPETVVNMCLEAFRSGSVYANANSTFSALFVSDAVEAIYRASKKDACAYNLYNVSSGEVVDESDVADLVQAAMQGQIDVTVDDSCAPCRVVLDGRRFSEEFGVRVHHRLEDTVPQIVAYLQKNASRFLNSADSDASRAQGFLLSLRGVLRSAVPVLENIALFAVAYFVTWATNRTGYFDGFDYYLLYVLMFAIVYGQSQAVLSSVLSAAGFLRVQIAAQGLLSVFIDINTYLWIAQLFIVGLSVGYLKDALVKSQQEAKMETDYLAERCREIRDINAENVRVKKVLESQLVNQEDSLGTVYSISKELIEGDDRAVIFRAASALSKLMESPDVSIYSISGPAFARLMSATSDPARSLGNSIRYTELGDLSDALSRRAVFVNRTLDPNLPSLARGIYSDSGLELIVLVWNVPWEKMTLSQTNSLTVACELIRDAVLNSRHMRDLLRSQRMIGDTPVMESKAFRELVGIYRSAAHEGLVVCCLLRIDLTGATDSLEQVSADLKRRLRDADYLGDYGGGGISVLLINSSETDARIVSDRLAKSGYPSKIVGIDDYDG